MTTTDTGTTNRDTLQKFIFDNAAVRGELVEISDTWREIQARHAYPKAVRSVLGEMVAAGALLSANLKFNGSIVMQIHGDGPVRLLVVECDANLRMRATAKLAPDVEIADDATLGQLFNVHGKGRFVITLDPADKVPGQQPYQGVVPLDGDDMATVIENYMLRSEQMDTRLWLAADDQVARGLLLQKLPRHSGKLSLDWDASPQLRFGADLGRRPGNLEPRRDAGPDRQARRAAVDRYLDPAAPPVLGRDHPRVRPAASRVPLQLQPREGRQYAQDAGPGRSRIGAVRAGRTGHQLRFLRQALRLRQGRLRAAVRQRQPGADHDAAER